MPNFSDKSLAKLATSDPRLQRVFHEVVRNFDCTILEGHRNKERQNRMVAEGKSQVRWPDGKHNTVPSMAVDVCPYPIVWDDRERQTLFAGYVLATAKAMGVNLRWGGDWDRDTEVRDNGFDDLVHFELVVE
jgi:peptidoglycan L-alanyl-D-glutamate endopeptidase CwlK